MNIIDEKSNMFGVVLLGIVINVLLFLAVIVSGIGNRAPDKITDWIAVIISGGALLISGFALTFLRGTFTAAKEQINVANEQLAAQKAEFEKVEKIRRDRAVIEDEYNRPTLWIAHKCTLEPFSRTDPVSQLWTIDEDGESTKLVRSAPADTGRFIFEFEVDNIGKTVANDVKVGVLLKKKPNAINSYDDFHSTAEQFKATAENTIYKGPHHPANVRKVLLHFSKEFEDAGIIVVIKYNFMNSNCEIITFTKAFFVELAFNARACSFEIQDCMFYNGRVN